MKGKLVTMAVSFLLCVGMVGAGFASWVISNSITETAEGTIEVESVLDKRLKNVSINDDAAGVHFGAPAEVDAKAWFSNNDAGKEDLLSSVTITLNETNVAALQNAGVKTVTFTATISIPETNEAYNAAVEAGYIAGPTDTTATLTLNLDESAGEVKTSGTVEFNFAWGTSFVGNNPYNYFNSLWDSADDKTDNLAIDGEWATIGDCAVEVMGAIAEIGDFKFTITIVGTVA